MRLSLSFDIPDDVGDEQFALLDGVSVTVEGDQLPDAAIVSLLLRTAEEYRISEMLAKLPEAAEYEQLVDALAMTNARLAIVDDVMHMPAMNHLEVIDGRPNLG